MATIYALSSGLGKAGVAVVRLSGSHTADALQRLAGGLPVPRMATLGTLRHPLSGDVLDRGLVLWFPAPHSFTGEDMAELQIHGGRAVIEGVLAALGALEGFRLAEPGEFARRAFGNGKLDLTAAEGLADLIDAETAAQRRQAVRQSGGALRKLYEGWRERLVGALAVVEAALDFSDEDGVPGAIAAAAQPIAIALQAEISEHLADGRRGEILRNGVRVVIAGPPNAGKSTLMNALARRDVAIVSAHAGTTRDIIEVRLDLDGIPVILTDTAGIRENAGELESEGIRRALKCAEEADLVLWLSEAAHTGERSTDAATPPFEVELPGEIRRAARILRIATKTDIVDIYSIFAPFQGALPLSVRTGQGMDALLSRLACEAAAIASVSENAVITRARHRQELQACVDALTRFLHGASTDLELRAEDLRQVATALGRITGCVDVEDILDKIFGDFCIGK